MQKKSSIYPINFEFVTGDFDSIRMETLQYCRAAPGGVVLQIEGHDKSDLTKSLDEIMANLGHTVSN